MNLETWLPFARPHLASVAAFVGEERERERAQREERVRSQAREEALKEFGELTRELSHLVPRLARMHDDSLEVLCVAVHGARDSPVAALLRRFWAETGDLLASQPGGVFAAAAEERAEWRGGAGATMPESTKSRAHRAELFLKLNIRKTLRSPAEKVKRSCMAGSPRKAVAIEEKQRRPEGEGSCRINDESRRPGACEVRANQGCVLNLCLRAWPCVPVERAKSAAECCMLLDETQTLANYIRASRARSDYRGLVECNTEADFLTCAKGRGDGNEAQQLQCPAKEASSCASLSSFSGKSGAQCCTRASVPLS